MKRSFILLVILAIFQISDAQTPAEIYRRPLKEVLSDIGKRYDIQLQYSESLVKDLVVTYPIWRYRNNVESTLINILYPLDLVFEKRGENIYRITGYAYHIRPVEEGKMHLDKLLYSYPDLRSWELRKEALKTCIFEQIGLSPMPERKPLNPVYTGKRKYDGYTVENIAIETVPGLWLCGSLYRPSKGKGPFPAVLATHGHTSQDNLSASGRYRPDHQYRCATLARMGAVVFSYEMFGYGESLLQIKKEDHRTSFSPTIQTWNSIRVVDFVTSLPYVDSKRIGCSGESGGGTQTFILAALDERVTVSVPVVMVSSYFYGGCPCESGLPIHSCTPLMTNNAEIAAMASPRPLLVISDGNDWTANVPEIEFPYLRKVYELSGKQENVENVHLASEGHDYGPSKRFAMYEFMARHLGLNINAVRDKDGKIDESKATIEDYKMLLVFGPEGKMLPGTALVGLEKIKESFRSLQKIN